MKSFRAFLRQLDAWIYRGEKALVGFCLSMMTVLIFIEGGFLYGHEVYQRNKRDKNLAEIQPFCEANVRAEGTGRSGKGSEINGLQRSRSLSANGY